MYEQLVKSIQEKVSVKPADLESIKRFFMPKKIRKRQYLLNAGDVCQYITFVEKGLLRSFTIDDRAHEHVMQFAAEGWWISDINSLLTGEEAVYNIEALEDSELFLLSNGAMDDMMQQFPAMERYFRLLMQRNNISLQRRIISSLSYSAEQKYTKLMAELPDIISRAPQQYIASYLGITPETLSRIRRQVSLPR